MSSIYSLNTILHEHPTFICYKICIQICRSNLRTIWLVHYLKIWVTSWVVAYLKWCLIRWSFNHVVPKFSNSIYKTSLKYLCTISIDLLQFWWITLKCWLWPTIWRNIATCSSTQLCKLSMSKFLSLSSWHSLKKRCYSHTKHVDTLYIIAVVNFIQVFFAFPHPWFSKVHKWSEALKHVAF